MKWIVFVLAPMLALGTIAGVADAQSGPTITQRVDDAAITTEVKARLVRERPANLVDINVDTRQGVVQLRGSVPTLQDKMLAEEIARQASGVRAVYNDLVVQGTATSREGATAASPGSGFIGRHTVSGEVTDVDAARGKIEIRTSDGDMELRFPPGALHNVRRGDRISVEMALRPVR